jgi:hypothetical protein
LFLEPNLNIILLSADHGRSKSFSKQINRLLRNTPWLKHLAPEGKVIFTNFNVSGLDHKKKEESMSVSSFSVLSNFTGQRADLVIIDDPFGSKTARSWVKANQILEALPEVYDLLNPAGRHFKDVGLTVPEYAKTQVVCLYTPHQQQPSDAYTPDVLHPNHFMKNVDIKSWPAVIDPVYDEDGRLVGGRSQWEARFDMDFWREESDLHPINFILERQVDPRPRDDEMSLIRLSKITELDIDNVKLSAFVDPSLGGDEYAVCFAGMHKTTEGSNIYLRRVQGWRGKEVEDLTDLLLDACEEMGVGRIFFENNIPLDGVVGKRIRERQLKMVVEPFKSSRNKEHKIKDTLPYLMGQGSVLCHSEVLNDPATVEQLRGLRAGPGLPPSDDRIESIWFACDHFADRVTAKKTSKGPKRRVNFAG